MKQKLLLFILGISLVSISSAQMYENGIGLRGGVASGVTFKHFLKQETAADLILSSWQNGFLFTGLLEIHKEPFKTDGMFLYFGAGGHAGIFNNFPGSTSDVIIGIDGVIGVEYVIREIPISISFDFKPGFNLLGYPGFWDDGFGLSVRYYF